MPKHPILNVTIIALLLSPALNIITACSTNSHIIREIETLLPTDTENSPWRKIGPPSIYRNDRLFEYINGGAEIYFEYGFHQAVTQEYARGDKSIFVEIYEMDNSDAAFGIYSIQRDYKLPALKIGSDGTQFDNHTLFWQDRYVVVVMESIPSTVSKEVLNRLAQKISLKIGTTSEPPKLVGQLPQKYIIPGSRGFINGILGLNSQYYLIQEDVLELDHAKVEGAFATYRSDSEKGYLLLVQYSDPRKSKAKADLVQKIFAERYKPYAGDFSFYKDKNGRFYTAKFVNKFLFIIFKSDGVSIISEILQQGIPIDE